MKADFTKRIFPKKKNTKFYDFSSNYRFQLNNLQIKLPFLIHLIEITKPFSRSCFIDYYGGLRGCLFTKTVTLPLLIRKENIQRFFFPDSKGGFIRLLFNSNVLLHVSISWALKTFHRFAISFTLKLINKLICIPHLTRILFI